MRFHWQNLSDEPGHERHGFWHGRAWWRFFDDDCKHNAPTLKLEWSHGRAKLACMLEFERDERAVQLHVAVPGASYFLTLEGLPRKLFDRLPFSYGRRGQWDGGERSIGFRVFDEAIWLSLWEDRNEFDSKDPKWMRRTIRPLDIVFGKTHYTRRELETRSITIPMPERPYAATATKTVSTWIRPRWPWKPFSTYRVGVDIEIPGGIGIPGKGENSWDIDDDAVFSQSSPAHSIEEAIGNVVASVLGTRRRRGWRAPELKAVP